MKALVKLTSAEMDFFISVTLNTRPDEGPMAGYFESEKKVSQSACQPIEAAYNARPRQGQLAEKHNLIRAIRWYLTER
jgi:hypothetical protein